MLIKIFLKQRRLSLFIQNSKSYSSLSENFEQGFLLKKKKIINISKCL